MNIAHKLIEDKNNLAIEIDNLFYDIENIEQQASALRTIVKAFDVETMEIVKGFLTQEVKDQNYKKINKQIKEVK
jgi:hypothetical protein